MRMKNKALPSIDLSAAPFRPSHDHAHWNRQCSVVAIEMLSIYASSTYTVEAVACPTPVGYDEVRRCKTMRNILGIEGKPWRTLNVFFSQTWQQTSHRFVLSVLYAHLYLVALSMSLRVHIHASNSPRVNN